MRWLTPVTVGLGLALAMAVALAVAAAPMGFPEGPLAVLGRLSFHTLCHQLPERSFQLDGHAMGLCHRCTGIYAGVGVGGLLAALGLRGDPQNRRVWLALAGFMFAQVCAGWLTDELDLWPLRVLTGVLLGGWGGFCLATVFRPRPVEPTRTSRPSDQLEPAQHVRD